MACCGMAATPRCCVCPPFTTRKPELSQLTTTDEKRYVTEVRHPLTAKVEAAAAGQEKVLRIEAASGFQRRQRHPSVSFR